MVELYLRYPTRPHGVVLNELSTDSTLPLYIHIYIYIFNDATHFCQRQIPACLRRSLFNILLTIQAVVLLDTGCIGVLHRVTMPV
jgi:hypothetical protein